MAEQEETLPQYLDQVVPIRRLGSWIKKNRISILIALAFTSTFVGVRWAVINHPNWSSLVIVALASLLVDKHRKAKKRKVVE